MKFKINYGVNNRIVSTFDTYREFLGIFVEFIRSAIKNNHPVFEITIHTDFDNKAE